MHLLRLRAEELGAHHALGLLVLLDDRRARERVERAEEVGVRVRVRVQG